VDPSSASLDVLPAVAAQVAGRVPILLDSGVRTGADVFLALALGASAVVIGRLAAYGLAAAGEHGVRRTVELLTEELHILMTLAGIPDIGSLTAAAVARCP
jgi:4-hydroxymandelate oxidase